LVQIAFSSMALVNFTDSVIETFNIQEEEMNEKCLDDPVDSSEVKFKKLIVYICRQLNMNINE